MKAWMLGREIGRRALGMRDEGMSARKGGRVGGKERGMKGAWVCGCKRCSVNTSLSFPPQLRGVVGGGASAAAAALSAVLIFVCYCYIHKSFSLNPHAYTPQRLASPPHRHNPPQRLAPDFGPIAPL